MRQPPPSWSCENFHRSHQPVWPQTLDSAISLKGPLARIDALSSRVEWPATPNQTNSVSSTVTSSSPSPTAPRVSSIFTDWDFDSPGGLSPYWVRPCESTHL